jgi:hypothetical protein
LLKASRNVTMLEVTGGGGRGGGEGGGGGGEKCLIAKTPKKHGLLTESVHQRCTLLHRELFTAKDPRT